jgi:hypothetical protein
MEVCNCRKEERKLEGIWMNQKAGEALPLNLQ